MKKIITKLKRLPAIITIAVISLLIAASGFWGTVERYIYDLHTRVDYGMAAPPGIVIVAIDDATLDVMSDRLGGLKWPYPRAVHAAVLENLARLGARIVFFDILFDLPSGYGKKDDSALEQALKRIPTILAAETDQGVANHPQERFLRAGAKEGNVLVPLDIDGVVRDISGDNGLPKGFGKMIRYFCGGWMPLDRKKESAAIAALPSAASVVFQYTDGVGKSISPPGMIRFFGPPGSFTTISYFELYDWALAEKYRGKLEGKIIFIGRTLYASLTPGQQSDLFLTPYRPNFMAGVEIHAHNLASFANNRIIRLVAPAMYLPLFILWVIICTAILGWIKQPLAEFAVLVGMVILLEGAAFTLYHHDLALLIGPFLIFSILYFVYTALSNYIKERDAKLLVRAQLFRYLPEKVANHIMAQPFRMAIAGDRSEITVLFADLEGFTTLSEALPTSTVITLLQSHLKDMTEAIFAHDGTLDKFLGDGVMAFWGAPEPQENQSDLAIAAAQNMLKRVEDANKERKSTGLPELRMRIGLHSGEAVVGNVGSSLYIDYTAIGDTVNTASRTEGINKYFGTRLLISDACLEKAGAGIKEAMHLAGRVSVKGKKKAISFFSPATREDEEKSFQKLAAIMNLLDHRDNEKAQEMLLELTTKTPEFGPAHFHLERLQYGELPLYDEEGKHHWPLDKK